MEQGCQEGGGTGQGEHCKENPECSRKAARIGIHHPLGDVFIVSVSHSSALGAPQQSGGCQSSGWDTGSPSSPTKGQVSHIPHQPIACQPCWTLEQPWCYFWTLGHIFSLGCFLSTRETRVLPQLCMLLWCSEGLQHIQLWLDHSQERPALPAQSSVLCGNTQKSYINLFSPSGIRFSKCTSHHPCSHLAQQRGCGQAGRAVHPSLNLCSAPGSSSPKSLWKREVILPLFVPPLACSWLGCPALLPDKPQSQPQHTAPGLAPTFD